VKEGTMKKLFIILTLSFISNFSFSQIFKINVFEVIHSYSIDTVEYSLTELLNKKDLSETRRIVDSSYELDLTHKHLNFYANGVFDREADLVFTNIGNFYTIYFLIDGYNIGMLINMDPSDEQVTWFSLFGAYQEISRFTKFEIVKQL
jgi:hypothetical protein